MNKYEVKIVSNIEGSQVILLQAFLYANNEDTANGSYTSDNDIDLHLNIRNAFSDCIIEYDDEDKTVNMIDALKGCVIEYSDGDYTKISDCDSVFDESNTICDLNRNICDDPSSAVNQGQIRLEFNGAGPYLHFTTVGA